MSEKVTKYKVEDNVATITFNIPDKLNALTYQFCDETMAHLTAAARDPEVGAVVVTGEGRAFSAGGDVAAMAEKRPEVPGMVSDTVEAAVDGLRSSQEICWLLHSMPKITIAMVNGHAMGAGLGIAMSCDLRVASSKAKFGTAYANVGFGGDFGTTWQLTQLVGEAKAKELMILGDIIGAEEAQRINLVNKVVEPDALADTVKEMATRIARGPQVSYRYMKENINLAVRSDFRTILDREAMTHVRCSLTEDHREGVTAFVEKRSPDFKGR